MIKKEIIRRLRDRARTRPFPIRKRRFPVRGEKPPGGFPRCNLAWCYLSVGGLDDEDYEEYYED